MAINLVALLGDARGCRVRRSFWAFRVCIFNVVSAGLLVTVITVGVLFLIFAVVHYLIWGWFLSVPVTRRRQALRSTAETGATFVVEFDDQERAELLRLLEQSLATKAGSTQQQVRRNLLEKLRVFGA